MQLGVDKLDVRLGLPADAPETTCGSLVHSYFKREAGPLERAQLLLGEHSQLPRPASQAALNGVRYEKKVLASLLKTFGNRVLPGPVFRFKAQDGFSGRAIPDALLFSPDFRSCCVVEVKLRHTGDAWHQLNRFYLPIVRKALPWCRVCGLEITSSYDPFQNLPQRVAFVENVEGAFETREAFPPVMILTARDLRNDRGMV